MPYIGARPVIEFSTIPSKDSFTGDGSTVAFDLGNDISTGGENALEVFVNNVRQEPGSGKAFTLGPDASLRTRRITFTAAPANGASIYVINDKTNSMTLLNPKDLNGVELILDSDADTSLTADTDDRIDFKIAGTDHFHITTSSGDTLIKQMTDAKDIIFQQYDGNKILEINDGNFVGIGGNATAPGEIRLYEDTDLGTNYVGFKSGNNTASVSYVLPTADGTAGYQLSTDGSGTLSWAAAGTTFANDGNNRIVTGTGSATLNGEANLTFDGSTLTNAGATQLNGALTVGANDQGYDVILYGDTASANVTWDTSADDLIFNGGAGLIIPDGQLTLGSTAVTSTAAELNLLDNVSGLVQADLTKLAAIDATAAEINLIDGITAGTVIASKAIITDSNIDISGGRNITISGELDAATLDISGAIDIAGASQFSSTITVGVDDTGYDVKLFGATSGKSLLWDECADTLIVTGNATISGTATTTGVHTFTAIPVLPANTIDSDMYVDGSIDTAHIADSQITLAKLAGGTDGNIISFDASGDPVAIATGSDGQVLTSTGAGSPPAFEALPAGGTDWQAVKTAGFTAVAGEGYFCDTTSAAFTLTLPAGTLGDEISFVDYAGTFDTNTLTVAPNGAEKIQGAAADLTISVERAANTLVYTDGTQGWLLKAK